MTKNEANKPNKPHKDGKTSWSNVAAWYDELVEDSSDSCQKNVLLPNLIRLVEPKKGMTIFDNAAGQGYFSRAFGESGATIIAADISRDLIEAAKKRAATDTGKPKDLSFHIAPANKILFQKDSTVDVVTIVLALQNIEDFAGAISESARVLKPGGRLIIVLNHPAFRIPRRSSWEWTGEGQEYRRIDAYMSDDQIKVDMSPGEKDFLKKKFTVSFHRPLQSYFKALNKAGLSTTRLEEWISHKKSQTGPRGSEEDRARKEIPMFLMIEAQKTRSME